MYIVTETSAKMPSSCKAFYKRICVVQLTQEFAAKGRKPAVVREFTNNHANGVLRIVREYSPVPAAGKTEKSGLVQTRKAAAELAHNLNNANDMATAEQIIGAGGSA